MDADTLDLSALTDDGDTLDLPDGHTLRLRIGPDTDASILDEQGEGVWCGRIEWDKGRTNDYGYRMRPDGFTGRSEVIERDGPYRLWWEVPADVEIGSDVHRALRAQILDLLRYGYQVVTLELLETCDHGDQHVVNSASMGVCDSVYPELVSDLVSEVLS